MRLHIFDHVQIKLIKDLKFLYCEAAPSLKYLILLILGFLVQIIGIVSEIKQ